MSSTNVSPPSSLPAGEAGLHVAILLTTYNGARFLDEQLSSIAQQTHRQWTLYISDDGSSDSTLVIIKRFQQRLGSDRVRLLHGPRIGFAQNFLSLVRNPEIEADFFSFCDQDDVWFPDKLQRAITRIACTSAKSPAVYCSRTRLIDEGGSFIGHSPLFARAPSFKNALVQSLAGANTMVLNKAARTLLATVPPTAPVVSHDWLCYLLVSGCGGHVFYDAEPTLNYRQHGGNLIGSNNSMRDRLTRVRMMFGGTFREWTEKNLTALRTCAGLLDERSGVALARFEAARDANLLRRLYLLKKAGVYRQTGFGTVGLIIAASIRRI
ncbi:glycosyltransferase family 2 protein [Stutzerimonas sp. R75]|uniref:glycosyltransferase family 2 protein n=1 Tax=Stutzerimonas sp. R75 TaxID=3439498 RepID=UPI0037D6CA3A